MVQWLGQLDFIQGDISAIPGHLYRATYLIPLPCDQVSAQPAASTDLLNDLRGVLESTNQWSDVFVAVGDPTSPLVQSGTPSGIPWPMEGVLPPNPAQCSLYLEGFWRGAQQILERAALTADPRFQLQSVWDQPLNGVSPNGTTPTPPSPTPEKKTSKTPLIIGGLAVLAIGGLLIAAR